MKRPLLFTPQRHHGKAVQHRRRILATTLLTLLSSWHLAKAQDISAQWLNGTGNWNDPTQWSTNPLFPNNGGGSVYAATVSAGAPTLNQNVEVDQLALSYSSASHLPPPSLTLQGANTLTVDSGFTWNTGTITGSGTLNSLGTTTISGTANNLTGGTLNTYGVTSLNGSIATTTAAASIVNQTGGTLNMADGSLIGGNFNTAATLTNSGTLNVNAPTSGATLGVASLTNNGTVNVNSGTLNINSVVSSSGTINVASGSTLNLSAFFTTASSTFTSSSSITGAGSANFNNGNVALNGAYNLTGSTTFSGATVTFGANTSFTSNSVAFQSGTVNFTGTTNLNQALTTFGNATVNVSGNLQSLGTSVLMNGQFANVTANVPVALDSLKITQGTWGGSGNLTIAHSFEWDAASMGGTGTTTAQSGILFKTDNSVLGTLNRPLVLYGNSSVQSNFVYSPSLNFGLNSSLTVQPGAAFNASHLMIEGSDVGGQTWGTFTNHGSLTVNDPGLNRGLSIFGTSFVNDGTVVVTNSLLDIRPMMNLANPVIIQNGGSLTLNNGTLSVSGEPFYLNGGSLNGHGTVTANIINNGLISPSGGNLVFQNQTLTLGLTSDLAFALGGNQAGTTYDQITSLTTASLGGDLDISFANGFGSSVSPTDTFTLLASSSTLSGQFANVPSGGRLGTDDGLGTFQVDYSGNSVVLSNYQALPEPSGGLLVLLGSCALGFARRRQ